MRTSITGLFAALFLFFHSPSAFSQSFEYANLFDSKHLIVIEIAPSSFISGDRAVDAYICKNADKYVCINSDWFNFAVPKNIGRSGEKWEQGGQYYELLGSGEMNFFGIRRSFLQIQSIQNGIKYRYLYSRKYGLVGFGAEIDGGLSIFMSQRGRGFGFGR